MSRQYGYVPSKLHYLICFKVIMALWQGHRDMSSPAHLFAIQVATSKGPFTLNTIYKKVLSQVDGRVGSMNSLWLTDNR